MISHPVDKEPLYESYLNDVIVSFLFIVTCEGNYRCWLFATKITNGDTNFPIHSLLTPVTIILLSLKLSKMLNITSTLWNTIGCCRGFEDMKDEISSSHNASDILG